VQRRGARPAPDVADRGRDAPHRARGRPRGLDPAPALGAAPTRDRAREAWMGGSCAAPRANRPDAGAAARAGGALGSQKLSIARWRMLAHRSHVLEAVA